MVNDYKECCNPAANCLCVNKGPLTPAQTAKDKAAYPPTSPPKGDPAEDLPHFEKRTPEDTNTFWLVVSEETEQKTKKCGSGCDCFIIRAGFTPHKAIYTGDGQDRKATNGEKIEGLTEKEYLSGHKAGGLYYRFCLEVDAEKMPKRKN